MADPRKLAFGPIAVPAGGVLIVFADDNLRIGTRTRSALGSTADLVARAARSERFTGKSGSALDIVMPAGLKATRLIVIGSARTDPSAITNWQMPGCQLPNCETNESPIP